MSISKVEESVMRPALKLRRQGLATVDLAVFVQTKPFREQDRQYFATKHLTLPVATADTAKIGVGPQRALAALWKPGFRYKKAGVMLVDLVKAASVPDAQGCSLSYVLHDNIP